MSACPLVVLACESLHVCTVCIWRCEHARFCVEGFYALYINFHSFIHSSSMEYSSSHLLNRVTVASSAASAILNLSERRVDAVKSGSLRCADEFKQQENKSNDNVRRQANLLS